MDGLWTMENIVKYSVMATIRADLHFIRREDQQQHADEGWNGRLQ